MLYRFDGKQPEYGQDTYISETALVMATLRLETTVILGIMQFYVVIMAELK